MFKKSLYTMLVMGTMLNATHFEWETNTGKSKFCFFFCEEQEDEITIDIEKDSYSLNEEIEVNFSNSYRNRYTWMAVYPVGHHHYVRKAWITNKTDGTHQFSGLAAGTYEVRLFSGYTFKVAARATFTVEEETAGSNRNDFQLFGDPELNRIVAMQMSTMKQVFEMPLNGENIYSSDIINDDKSYAYARGSNKIFVLNREDDGTFSEGKTIHLPFYPRTGAKNRRYGLTLVTGADKAMYAVIDTNTDEVVATGGRDEVTQFDDSNHGSKWATGHGVWLTDTKFVVPDREARELILYKINPRNFHVEELDRMDTSSSIHTIIGKVNNGQRTYYAVTEGADNVRPSLVKFKLRHHSIYIKDTVDMPGDDIASMTAHHVKPLPDGIHMYMGTSDGYLHVINTKYMDVIKSIKAGKGAGHTTLIPSRHLALVTNHKDTFVTAIDTRTHTKIKDIHVSGASIKNTALQSHTARVSADSKYYYNFATDNGYYFRIDLDTLHMDKTFYTGGTPKQASQPGEMN